jgi:hypothetical protein
MKKIGLLLALSALLYQTNGQATTKNNQEERQSSDSEKLNDNARVVLGKNLLSFEDHKDEFKVRIGKRGINILESLEGPKIAFEKFSNSDITGQDDQENKKYGGKKYRSGFHGNWSGVEFGFNNYLAADKSLVLPDNIYYMSLHSGKSSNFNINFVQLSLGFTRHFGIITGLGLNWNNYRFDGNNNIVKGANGIIEPFLPLNGLKLEKSKLATLYLTLPVMLEIQVPTGNENHINIAGGGIGAVKLSSHTKIVYHGDDQKIKEFDDFSLNMFRYGVSARVGYENFQLYGTYYMISLFETGKGPELYPFEVGFAFTFND